MTRRTRSARSLLVVAAVGAALAGSAFAQGSAAAVIVSAAALAQAQPEPLSLFERHVREIGGADRLRAVKSRTVKGMVRNPKTGFVGRIIVQTAEPNLTHTWIEAPGIASWDTVFNGQVGWTRTVEGVTTIQEGDDLADLRFNAFFHAELEPSKRFARLETVEQLNWNGRPSYRVRGTSAEGRIHDTIFDAESGLITGVISYRGDKPHVTLVLGDYKEFDGLKVAATITQRREGQDGEFVTSVSSVEFNKVDPAIFNADSDVQRAIENGGRWPPRKPEDEKPPPASGPRANPAGPGQPR